MNPLREFYNKINVRINEPSKDMDIQLWSAYISSKYRFLYNVSKTFNQ